ncbi:hypothetical protein [Streptomyces prunicolor]|jgi:hypothetical protein|uniref:hypothetical protein n=1 Tax=Streptomyces prunicolor TaxID=67348 RepID=UPI00035EBE99|nr:hypothetical protein [Streptomyces prunicolor]
MFDVRSNRENKRGRFVPVEQARRYLVITSELRSFEPVHPVDDPHRRTVHHDRGQFMSDLSEAFDIFNVLAGNTRTV